MLITRIADVWPARVVPFFDQTYVMGALPWNPGARVRTFPSSTDIVAGAVMRGGSLTISVATVLEQVPSRLLTVTE